MKEKIEQLYIVENKSTTELAEIFKVTSKTIRQWLKKYDITKPKELINKARQEARKKNNLEKYGVEHTSQLKENREKMKETCLERFGVDNGAKAKAIKEKVKQNNLEKYGETNPLKVQAIKERIRLEQIKKKGFAYPYQQHKDPSVVEILSTKENLENYLKSFENKPTIHELCEKFNYSHCALLSRIKELESLRLVDYKPNTSQYEKELNLRFNNIFKKDRKILNPQEIDLYCSDYKLGIEFNGNYWHSIDNKGKNYHQNKTLKAIEKGVRLIHIFEYEWLDKNKKEKITSLINNIVDDDRQYLYARQCIIKEIPSEISKVFLDKYHLQGADTASVRVGLFYKDLLVAIMTFCKPRFNKKFEWELSRLCFHSNFKVIGGAERLLKYFEKTYNPKNIITYCDISKFIGKVYKRLGFSLKDISKPNYIWSNSRGDIFTRYQCQKHKLVNRYPEYHNLSEGQIMTSLGYWKIEDSGNQVWIKEY